MSGGGAVALWMDGVIKRAGAKMVLDGLSAEFRVGELTLIRGRRSSGKTTLARVLAGQSPPDGGAMRRAGRAAPLVGGAWGFTAGASALRGLELRAAAYGLDSGDFIGAVAALFDDAAILQRPFGELRGADRALLTFGASYLTPASLYVIDGAPLPTHEGARRILAPLLDAARMRAAVAWLADDAARAARFRPEAFLRLADGRLTQDDPEDRPAAPARRKAAVEEQADG